jgi:hypothetical protein
MTERERGRERESERECARVCQQCACCRDLLGIAVTRHLNVELEALTHNGDDAVVGSPEEEHANGKPRVACGRRCGSACHGSAEARQDEAAHGELVRCVHIPQEVERNERAA